MENSRILSFEEFVLRGDADQMPGASMMPMDGMPVPAENPAMTGEPGSDINLQLMDEPAAQTQAGDTEMTGDMPLVDAPNASNGSEAGDEPSM
jgi:hypothetical protein